MSKQKLKKAVKEYLDLGDYTYKFVKVSESEIKKNLGFGTSDWDPMVAYYVRNCLANRYTGMGHNIYPVPDVWSLDSIVIAEKFDLFPLATLSGTETAVHLGTGEVYEIAAETFDMDYWGGEVEGIHEPSLLDYFSSRIEAATAPGPDLSYLELRDPEAIKSLEKIKQYDLFIRALEEGDLDLLKIVLRETRWNRRTLAPGTKYNLLESCVAFIGTEEVAEYLVSEKGFRIRGKVNVNDHFRRMEAVGKENVLFTLIKFDGLEEVQKKHSVNFSRMMVRLGEKGFTLNKEQEG